MPASVGSLFELGSSTIREIINGDMEVIMPTLDVAWRDTFVTSQGVLPPSQLGRDMVAIRTFKGGLTGVIDAGWPRKDFTLYGDQSAAVGSKLYLNSATQTWPDALEGPNPKPYRLKIHLRTILTNLAMTLGEMTLDATEANINEYIAPKLELFAHNLSHTLCNYWYMSQNAGYSLDRPAAGATAVTLSNSNKTGTFALTNQCYDRFQVGQRLDLWSYSSFGGSSSTRFNETGGVRLKVFCTAVDPLKGTISITAESSLVTMGFTDSNGLITSSQEPYITYANTFSSTKFGFGGGSSQGAFFTGIAGINSWLKTGSVATSGMIDDTLLLGAEADQTDQISVSTHPEFKSFGKASVGTLTEHKLRQYLARFHHAKKPIGQTIDCLIASEGVWLHYESQKIGREILDRTGRLSSLNNEGSEEGMTFTFEGRKYKGYTSTYIESGVMYGIKKGGKNWKRLVPPTPKGTTKLKEADSFLPFNFVMGALTGTQNPRWPILTNNGASVTDAVQLPGFMHMQLVPDQPAGMKLTGLTEDRIYAD